MVVGTRQAGSRQAGERRWRAVAATTIRRGRRAGDPQPKAQRRPAKAATSKRAADEKQDRQGSVWIAPFWFAARVCSRAKRSTTICLEQSRQGAGGAAALSRHANGASPPSSPLMRRLVRKTHTQQSPVSQSEPKGRRSRGRREGEPPLEARHQCRPHRALVSPLGRLRRGRIGSRASRSSGTLAVSNPSVRKGSTTHI